MTWVKVFKNAQNLKNFSLGRPHHFKFFKGCFPQILLGLFLNTLTHLFFSKRRLPSLQYTSNCRNQKLSIYAQSILRKTLIRNGYFGQRLLSDFQFLYTDDAKLISKCNHVINTVLKIRSPKSSD